MVLSLPTGRTQDGVVLSKALSAPLAPSGRQLDLTTKLQFPWLGGDVSLGATRSGQPQHQQTAAPQWTLFHRLPLHLVRARAPGTEVIDGKR